MLDWIQPSPLKTSILFQRQRNYNNQLVLPIWTLIRHLMVAYRKLLCQLEQQKQDDIQQQKGQSHRLMEKSCTGIYYNLYYAVGMCMYYNVHVLCACTIHACVCTIMCMYYKPLVLYGRKSLAENHEQEQAKGS